MKKVHRVVIVFLSVLLLIIMGGCTQKEKTDAKCEDVASEIDTHKSYTITGADGNITIKPACFSYSVNDSFPRPVDLHLFFPQIYNLSDSRLESQINMMLFDAALKGISSEASASNIRELIYSAQKHAMESPSLTDIVAEIDYEVLLFNEDYLSIRFFGSNTPAAIRVNFFEYYVLIDLNTGSYCRLTDYVPEAELENDIRNGQFEVVHGNYVGGWTIDEIKDDFILWIEQNLNTDFDVKTHEFSFGDHEERISYTEYNKDSVQNYALDDSNIYVRFDFFDATDSYVILKFPQKSVIPFS